MLVLFRFGLKPARYLDDALEHALAHFVDRFSAIDHAASGMLPMTGTDAMRLAMW